MPVIAVLAYNEIEVRRSREAEVRGYALASARQTALELDRITAGAKAVLDAIATAPAIQAQDWAGCEDFLGRLSVRLPQFLSLSIVDVDGTMRCRSDGLRPDIDFSDRPYLVEALEAPGTLQITDHTLSRLNGEATLPMSMAFQNEAGAVSGVAVASVSLSWLGELIRNREIPDDGSVTIADRNGIILAREPFPERFVGTSIPDEFMDLVTGEVEGTREVISQDGTRRYIGYVPAAKPPLGLYVSVGLSQDAAFKDINAATVRVAYLALGAMVCATLASLLLHRSLISGPVKSIAAVIQGRRNGQETLRTGLSPEDGDLGTLGEALDQYFDEAKEAKKERDAADRRRMLMAEELSHRLKNQLATVQAIAGQTFKGEAARQMLSAFNGRLTNIAQAQQLLLQGNPEWLTLRAAISGAVRVFEERPGARFVLEGDDFPVLPNASLSISMAMHELGTNAVKYGALSMPNGRVNISWHMLDGELWVTWKESDGPHVSPPVRKGFGTKLINELLTAEIGGDVFVEFETDGVKCVIRGSLERITGLSTPPDSVKGS